MKLKKITSIVLASTLLAGSTGCSQIMDDARRRKDFEEEYEQVLNNLDYSLYDGRKSTLASGTYVVTYYPIQIEQLLDSLDIKEPEGEDVVRLVYANKYDKNNPNSSIISALVIFKDEDSASDYFDDVYNYSDKLIDRYSSFKPQYSLDDDFAYLAVAEGDNELMLAAFLDGDSVYYVYAQNNKADEFDATDEADYICGHLGLEKPSKLLD